MVPSFYFPEKFKPDDDRRVRSIMVEELEKSAIEGDTLLDIRELLYKVRERFPGERECKPDLFLIKQNKKFYEDKLTFLGEIPKAHPHPLQNLLKNIPTTFLKKHDHFFSP